jgi:outer membrane protein TolC
MFKTKTFVIVALTMLGPAVLPSGYVHGEEAKPGKEAVGSAQTVADAGVVPIAEPQGAAAPQEAPKDRQVLADSDMPKEALVRAGQVYFDWKDYASALNKWEEALRRDPADKKLQADVAEAKARFERQEARTRKAPAELKVPKDIAKKKPLFNLNFLNKEKPKLNIGRRWFNWFQKERNEPAMPPGKVLSLDDCVTIAVRNHIPLQVAQESMRLASMKVNETKRNLLPSATMCAERYTGEVNGRQYDGVKNYIEGQQPVFAGGQIWYAMRQAQVNAEMSKCDYDKLKNDLTLQVKKNFYTVGKTRGNLRIQKELSQDIGRIFEMVKKEADFGVTSKLEFLNAGSQAAQVRYQLVAAEGDVEVAELMLKQTMNVDPRDTVLVDPDLEFKKADVSYEEAVRASYVYRPEIKMNTLMVQYYDYGRNVAKGKFWPKVDILGSWGIGWEEYCPQDRLGPYSGLPGAATALYDCDPKLEQQWYAGVKTSAPLWGSTFEYSWTREQWYPVVSAYQGTEAATNSWKVKILDKLDIYSDRQQAQIDYDRARQELNKAKQDVTLEVKEGCFNYVKALVQLDVANKKVRFQENDLEYVRFRRQLDEVQDPALMESMIKLAQERYGYVQALTDCHITLATVNKSIGVEDFYKDEKASDK